MMITMKKALALLLVIGCTDRGVVYGFATRNSNIKTRSDTTMLSLQKNQPSSSEDGSNINAPAANLGGVSSFLAAAVIAANVLSAGADPAMAAFVDNDNNMQQSVDFGGGTTQLLAARSGGRAGGRSAVGRSAPSPAARNRSSSSSTTSTNTRVIERTRYVPTPGVGYGGPSVIVSPPMYYNPFPGYGLGLGLNAINQIGNDMRDYRQENEIQSTRAQLQQSQMREAEMEARLRQLESASQQQGGQLSPQQQQQLLQLMQQQQQMLQQQQQPAATVSP